MVYVSVEKNCSVAEFLVKYDFTLIPEAISTNLWELGQSKLTVAIHSYKRMMQSNHST